MTDKRTVPMKTFPAFLLYGLQWMAFSSAVGAIKSWTGWSWLAAPSGLAAGIAAGCAIDFLIQVVDARDRRS